MASALVLAGVGIWVILQTTKGPLADKLGFASLMGSSSPGSSSSSSSPASSAPWWTGPGALAGGLGALGGSVLGGLGFSSASSPPTPAKGAP